MKQETQKRPKPIPKVPHVLRDFVLNNTSDPMLVAVRTTIVEANDALARLFGYGSRDEMIGRSFADVASPDSFRLSKERVAERMAGKSPTGSQLYTMVRKDGERFMIESSVISWPDDPSITVAVLRDVTEREKRVDRLRESEELYRALAETIPAGVMMEDTAGRVFYANEQMSALSGYSVDELKRGVWLLDPRDKSARAEYWKALREGTSGDDLRAQLIRKNGDGMWVSISWRPIRSSRGPAQGTVSTFIDVTQRMRTSEALRESEASMRTFLNALTNAAFLLDTDGNVIIANEWLARVFGTTTEDLQGRSIATMMPEDVTATRRAFADQVIRTGKPLQFEDEHDGKSFAHYVSPVFDDAGKVFRIAWIAFDVTDRKWAEAALRLSEKWFRTLVGNIAGAVVRVLMVGDPVIDFTSDAIESITGFRPKHFFGRPTSVFTDLIHPEDRERVHEAVMAALQERRPFLVEYRLLHRDGRTRICRERGQGIADDTGKLVYIDSIVFDVSELQETEHALRESEERFRSLVDNIPGAVIRVVANEQRTIDFVSDSIEPITGYPPSHFVGRPVSAYLDLIHLEDVDRVLDSAVKAICEQQPYFVEYRLQRRDGSIRVLRGRGKGVYDNSGRRLFVDTVIFDVTEQHEAEEQLREAHANLEKAYQIQREFLNNVTHEIRTPMTAVKGYVEMLLEGIAGPLNEQQETLLRKVLAGSDSLVELVSSLLEVARLRTGRVSLRPKACKPGAVAEKAVSSVMPQAEKKGLPIDLRVHGQDRMGVYDEEKVIIILNNLLSNAVKFTSRGHIEIQVRSRRSGVEMIVSDTGSGIGQKNLGSIFDQFQQLDHPGRHKPPGFGLGLAIVANMVMVLGATLVVSSKLGVGTAFTLVIPEIEAGSS